MILDLNKYKWVIPTIERTVLNRLKDGVTLFDLVGELAVSTNVPITAIALYCENLYGKTPEFCAKIERLKSFYKYDKIIELNNVASTQSN